MKIIINIEKKHLYFLAILITIFIVIITASAFNPNLPWHPLQQVAKSSSDLTSVDADDDGIIDKANYTITAGNADTVDEKHASDFTGKTILQSIIFEPSPYWSGTASADVSGFSITINTPTSGTIVAMMNALVKQDTAGKAIYVGPKIDDTISYGNRGGYRTLNADDPKYFGTAAFNTKTVSAGTHTIQVHAFIDGGTAQVAWGSLVVYFIPS